MGPPPPAPPIPPVLALEVVVLLDVVPPPVPPAPAPVLPLVLESALVLEVEPPGWQLAVWSGPTTQVYPSTQLKKVQSPGWHCPSTPQVSFWPQSAGLLQPAPGPALVVGTGPVQSKSQKPSPRLLS